MIRARVKYASAALPHGAAMVATIAVLFALVGVIVLLRLLVVLAL